MVKIDIALHHYQRCIYLLQEHEPANPTLARAYIHRAWIYMQERPDLKIAEENLQQAKALFDSYHAEDMLLFAEWRTAWNGLQSRLGNSVISEMIEGYIAVQETDGREQQMIDLHNLGNQLCWKEHRYTEALEWFEKSLSVAKELGNRERIGHCYLSIGSCYFSLNTYDKAIEQYLQAYMLLVVSNNRKVLVSLCFNLAMSYFETEAYKLAQKIFQEGLEIAQQLGMSEHIKAYHDYASSHPWLNYRELANDEDFLQVLAYLRQYGERRENGEISYGEISNREYCELRNVANKAASTHLKKWVDRGVSEQIGQGAGTRYQLKKG